MTRQYDNRGRDQINIEQIGGDVVIRQPRSSRSHAEELLLQEIDREVESRLAQSLHNAAFINLGKQSQPEQVKRIWDVEVKIGAKPPEPLPPDVSILNVFERSDIAGKLLILGDPGAGKTTTMLDLAQALIDKAKQDANYSIPVLINLSGWQEPRQSMPDWLVEELKSKYGVRKDIGKQWLQDKRLLPLLDGLDEVKPEYQAACVQAINQWLGSDRRPIYVVVCSRREEYANSQTQLHLNGAILLQALTEEQIQDYLNRVNRAELWHVLQQDAVLLDLMKTPLLLSITVLSYKALSLQQWHQLTSTQERLDLLLDAYIQTMLDREFQSRYYRNHKPPTAAQTQHWLTFLAQQLQRDSQTEFLIERTQPDWLLTGKQRIAYRLTCGSIFGSIYGLILGLHIVLSTYIRWLRIGPIDTINLLTDTIIFAIAFLIIGLVFGLVFGLTVGLIDRTFREVKPVEVVRWSFKKARKGLIIGLIIGLTLRLIGTLGTGLNDGLISALIQVLSSGLAFMAIGSLFGGLSRSQVEIRKSPNQGIWQSAINALLLALILGLIVGLIGSVLIGEISHLGLIVGLIVGLSFGGGNACVQHVALRLVLYRNGSIPWNYARFLNYCTERLFLQRVGGRYRFVHKLLQERFVELDG